MSPLIWAILALLLGLCLVALEFFVPSGGFLAFLALAALVTSLVLAYSVDPYWGLGFTGLIMLAVPAVVITTLQWFPYTPIGRRILLAAPDEDDVLPEDGPDGLRGLIGRTGQATSMMRPSGAVRIDGRTIDAVSRGIPIDEGQTIKVVDARSNRVVVVPYDERLAQTTDHPASGDNPLDRPIESAHDPFENPFS